MGLNATATTGIGPLGCGEVKGSGSFTGEGRLGAQVAALGGVHGHAELVVAAAKNAGGRRVNGADGIKHLFHRQPLRLFFPHPSPEGSFTAVLGNISGGMVGGDRYTLSLEVEDEASVLFTGQAAEKVYRSAGDETTVEVDVRLGSRAALYWLPQGTILFDGCRLRRRTTFDVAPEARLLAGEIVMFGRSAMGERLRRGLFHDDWRVLLDGRLIWADAFHIAGDLRAGLDHPATLGGARAMANCVYVAQDAAARLEDARRVLADTAAGVRAAATAFEGLLLIRWFGDDAAALRHGFGYFWSRFGREIDAESARPSSIWHI